MHHILNLSKNTGILLSTKYNWVFVHIVRKGCGPQGESCKILSGIFNDFNIKLDESDHIIAAISWPPHNLFTQGYFGRKGRKDYPFKSWDALEKMSLYCWICVLPVTS